jgi:hypothetical protein
MSLTKIQPSGLDQTKGYAVDSLTANTIISGGTDVSSVSVTANVSLVLAQGAFGAANTNTGNITTLQGVNVTQNNSITAVSNYSVAAYNEANTASTVADNAYLQSLAGIDSAQASYTQSNSAVTQANVAFIQASAAFTKANTISYPSSGIANSNGSGWSTSYSTTGSGSVLSLNTSPIITNPTVTNYVETPYVVNSSTALTIDLSNGTVQVVTLTGSPTITMPAAVAGKSFIMYLKTGSGSYTVTWSTVKWPSTTAPTLTSTASKMDIFSFFSDGTNWYGVTVGQNYAT